MSLTRETRFLFSCGGPRGILGRPLTLRAALRSRCMARTRSMDDGRRACESHTRHTRADRDTDTDTDIDTHTALPSAGRETRARRSLVAGAHAASPCTDMVGARPPPPLALELRLAAAERRRGRSQPCRRLLRRNRGRPLFSMKNIKPKHASPAHNAARGARGPSNAPRSEESQHRARQ